jgi:hypothetical protein
MITSYTCRLVSCSLDHHASRCALDDPLPNHDVFGHPQWGATVVWGSMAVDVINVQIKTASYKLQPCRVLPHGGECSLIGNDTTDSRVKKRKTYHTARGLRMISAVRHLWIQRLKRRPNDKKGSAFVSDFGSSGSDLTPMPSNNYPRRHKPAAFSQLLATH